MASGGLLPPSRAERMTPGEMRDAAGEAAARVPPGGIAPVAESGEATRWRVWDDTAVEPASVGVARDVDMATSVAQGVLPPTARLWTTRRAIVATEREGRRPGFADAARRLEAEGWPVALRATGGSAFPAGPGILNLSLVFPRACLREPGIESVYRILSAPIRAALGTLGLRAAVRCAPRAFCEGEFDLVVGGRKVAGTAQSWRAGTARGAVLAHAGILVAGDMREAAEAVDRFHRWSGGEGGIDPDAATTVEEALDGGARDRGPALMKRLRAGVKRALVAQGHG